MTRKRRFLIVAVAVTGIAIAASISVLALRDRPRLAEEQIETIREGMTRAEVQTVLGCKPGNYTRDNLVLIDMEFFSEIRRRHTEVYEDWAADCPTPCVDKGDGSKRQSAVAIRIWFDEEGKVVDNCTVRCTYIVPSTLDRIKDWIHR